MFSLIFLLAFISNINIVQAEIESEFEFDQQEVVAGGGTYKVTSRTNNDSLAYGMTYTRDIALSQSLNEIGGKQNFDPQVVNLVEMPVGTNAKVVNWTYSSANNWTKQTIKVLAKDFEENNPGWVVLAGINGDFFDINGKEALPYQTNGTAVVNGNVLRAVSGKQVGFTNDGSANSLIGSESLTYTDYHLLGIYDQYDNLIKEIKVDKLNEAPVDDEVSVYFSYNAFKTEGEGADAVKVRYIEYNTVPGKNSYLVDLPERSYANDKNHMYGKGVISAVNTEQKLSIGDFAVVTENDEATDFLREGVKIRVQQNVTGAYEKCENISGAGATLANNGEAVFETDGMSHYRHPRTVIGQQEDGTLVFLTVDGRQQTSGMYGMTYEELSAMMLYYGCTEAYNLDGGGSTTLIVRNKQGDFDVMNSPSDGNERSDSNALLIVAPEMEVEIEKATDTSMEFSYINKAYGIKISDIEVTLSAGDYQETRKMVDKETPATQITNTESYVWDNLKPNTTYDVSYKYKLHYQNSTTDISSVGLQFTTGNPKPTITNCYYEDIGQQYVIHFQINDENNLLISSLIKYDKKVITITKDQTILYIDKSKVEKAEFKLQIVYNVKSSHPDNQTMIIEIGDEPPHEHEFVDGECVCGEKDPNYEPPVNEIKPQKCGNKGGILIVELLAVTSVLGLVFKRK